MTNSFNTLNSEIDKNFGNWTVLKDLGTRLQGRYFDKNLNKIRPFYIRYYLVKCKCGKIREIYAGNLKNGRSKQCNNCAGLVRHLIHGMCNTLEYNSWNDMIHRCTSPNDINYKNYGGRGITVCKRWLNSVQNFFADMGPKPSPEYSIDRINNDGNYEPGNCRWATKKQQSNNRRKYKNSKIN